MDNLYSIISIFLVTITIILIIIDLYLRNQPHYKASLLIPGSKILPIIGNFLTFFFLNSEQSIRLTIDMAEHHKVGFRYYVFGTLHYWPIRAHEVEFLLNSTKFTEKSMMYKYLFSMIGDGLLCSNGHKWSQRRRILTPAFHFNILQQFLSIFVDESKRFVNGLNDKKHKFESNLKEIVPKFTLNNICETAMGVKLNDESNGDEYRHNVDECGKLITRRVINPLYFPDIVFKMTKVYRDLIWYTNKIHKFSMSVINQRRISYRKNNSLTSSEDNIQSENIYKKKNRYAMLDTLLEAEANNGQIDEVGILEEVETFMFEGYDTTSSGITFLLFMLALHQDIQQNVYEEILEEVGVTEDEPTIYNYGNMKYLDRVIKETLRLYPPVPYLSRQLDEPYITSTTYLPKDTQAHVFIYNLHRDPNQFPDPEKFDPDRFLPENIEKRHPFAYIPFSAGPRNCIGQKFAMLQIKTLITKILLQFTLHPVTKLEDIVLVSDIVLQTKHPIKIRFQKRSAGMR